MVLQLCKFKSCYLYMENIIWYKLNEKGFIIGDNGSLQQVPGIYVYRFTSDISRIYIGSAINIAQRFTQHRYRCSIYKGNNSKFYNLVQKYGWNNIEYGILEKLSAKHTEILINKNILLDREQYYLDKYSPSLNTNKIAGSVLGYKHTEENKLKFSSNHIGKSYKRTLTGKPRPLVTKETINKLKLRSRGAVTCIYDKNNVLVREFNTVKSAANFCGLSPSSVSKYITRGVIWNNTYYFK